MSDQLLIDTNIYSALMAGNREIVAVLDRSARILLSPIVLGELLDGFRGGSREAENRRILADFAAKPRSLTIPITATTAEWFAEIRQILRRKGSPIPANDIWIAACCMEHGARLFTLDRHFAAIDGLLREPW